MTSDLETNLALMKLRELAPESVEDAREFRGEVTIHIRPDRLITVCELLRDDPGLTFKYLSDLTAVDLYPNEPRFGWSTICFHSRLQRGFGSKCGPPVRIPG